jgi:membrane protein DedA with SNARE-associated domain
MEMLEQLNALLTNHSLVTALLAIIFATLVSEDLTCIGCGLLVARGDLPMLPAMLACAFGLWFGDLTLYGWGKFVGRPLLRRPPARWFLEADDVDACSEWYNRRGAIVIFLARVVPGCRLPTYFAAGLLHTSFLKFTLYAFLATAFWAPLLVWISMVIGSEVFAYFAIFRKYALLSLVVAVLAIYFVVKLIVPLFTFKGRRLLRGALRRKVRWEYWPSSVFYIPVIVYILWLSIKHRGLTLFTAANPGIYAGGFVNESKSQILAGLADSAEFVAATERLPEDATPEARLAKVRLFLAERDLDYPVVLKPDAGQRGSGVEVVHSDEEALEYLRASRVETLVQEYVSGHEFGVFYVRHPSEPKGWIYSITEKEFPAVEGDGIHTIEELILRDVKLLPMARLYLARMSARRFDVPAKGEKVAVSWIGNHCRGAVFRDGTRHKTPELEATIDAVSRKFDGFYYGRFDMRTPSVEDFYAGRNFKIIELNGATSEATALYDPSYSLFQAYRIILGHWRILYEIAAQNRDRGIRAVPLRTLAGLVLRYRMAARSHPV